MATGPVRASWDIGATKYGREYETIQEAIDGLPALGGVVQVPAGTWVQLTGLTLPTDRRVEIVGCGGGTILDSAAAITILTADNTTGFILKDIRFTGTPTTALSIQSATNPGLSNVRFELTSGTAIDTTSATNVSYNNVWDGTTLLNTAGSASAYDTIQEEGTGLTQRTTLNFIGGAITAADNVPSTRTDVTLSASPDSASVVGTGRTISTSGTALSGGGDLSANRTITLSQSPAASASVVGIGRNVSTGAGLAGGGDLSADRTLTWSPATQVNNVTLWDSANASRTLTAGLSGATDPVITFSDGLIALNTPLDVTTGYRIGGAAASGNVLRGDGTNFISAVLGVTDLSEYSATSGTGTNALRATITTPSTNDVLTWDGSNWINQAASGGGMTQPAVINTLSALRAVGIDTAAAKPSAGTWPTANLAYYIPFEVHESVTVKRMFIVNTTTVSGNYDVGIYNESGTRQVSLGSTAISGTNTVQVADIGDTALSAGRYYMAFAVDNTSYNPSRFAGNAATALLNSLFGVKRQTSAFPLPATATFAENAAESYIPIFGLTLET